MIKKFCDRCDQELLLTETNTPFRLARRSGHLCKRCSGVIEAAMDPTRPTPDELIRSMPTTVGPSSILWQGERWEKMTETVAPSESVSDLERARRVVEPHKISQAIGAAPVLDDPSVGDKTVEPGAIPSHDALEKATAARVDLLDHQPFAAPTERDDLWKPGDVACEVHACPYRAAHTGSGSSRCRDHL